MLDLGKKHALVFGDSVARYYQSGVYYDIAGAVVTAEEAGLPAEQGRQKMLQRTGVTEEAEETAADKHRRKVAEEREQAEREAAAAQAKADALLTDDDVAAVLEEIEDLEDAKAFIEGRLTRAQVQSFVKNMMGVTPSPITSKKGVAANVEMMLGAWRMIKEGADADGSDESSEGEAGEAEA